MKLLIPFLLLTAGCSTGVIKDDWTKSLIGRTGIIREPVQIVKEDKKNWAHFDEFQRCEPVEVVEARDYGKHTGLVVKQAGKLFYIWSAQSFVNEFKGSPTEAKLTEYLAPTKEIALGEKKTVKLTTGVHDSHELQCKATFWAGMSEQQLVFVKGKPDQINKSGAKEQWVYSKKDYQEQFDFENGYLSRF